MLDEQAWHLRFQRRCHPRYFIVLPNVLLVLRTVDTRCLFTVLLNVLLKLPPAEQQRLKNNVFRMFLQSFSTENNLDITIYLTRVSDFILKRTVL